MENNLIVTSNPHITDNVSTRKLMGNVVKIGRAHV